MGALVVDDSPTLRKLLIGYLADAGIRQVDEASDGDEGVALVAERHYQLILLDWNMPRMSGLDALRAIRAGGNKVPVIMVTTESEKSRVIEAIKAGANHFVLKPIGRETLVAAVRKVLGAGS
jgi:two-component system chemotaxis response regulator CheY